MPTVSGERTRNSNLTDFLNCERLFRRFICKKTGYFSAVQVLARSNSRLNYTL